MTFLITTPSRRNLATLLLAGLTAALLLAACSDGATPPTSPLGTETPTAPSDGSTPGPLSTFPAGSPAPTGTADPAPSTSTPAPGTDEERVTGEAIARLAEWTGEPQTLITFAEIEAVDWPNACIGVELPSFACAEVITPGYRITLQLGPTTHHVHASRQGRYAWAPTYESLDRTIEAIDLTISTLTLSPDRATPGAPTQVRIAPGTYLEAPLTTLREGQRLTLGTTLTPEDGEAPALATYVVPLD